MKSKSKAFDENTICAEIHTWFVKNHNLNLNYEEKFIEQGILDSFEIINFVLFIEETFRIKFSTDNFNNSEFFTIKGLASLILENQ